jgi:hypothetical protein
MKLDLYGNKILDASDFSKKIMKQFNDQQEIRIYHSFGTKSGHENDCSTIFPRSAIYCIYKNGKPIYVGLSRNSTHNRIGRFVQGALNKETKNTKHPGGRRYRIEYGDDLRGLSVKYFDMTKINLPEYISMEEIELDLIRKLKPKLNIQIRNFAHIEKCSLEAL